MRIVQYREESFNRIHMKDFEIEKKRQRQQQERHKFAYLIINYSRFAHAAYFQQLLDWMFWKWRFLLNYQLLWRFFLIKRKEPAHQTGERSYIIQ